MKSYFRYWFPFLVWAFDQWSTYQFSKVGFEPLWLSHRTGMKDFIFCQFLVCLLCIFTELPLAVIFIFFILGWEGEIMGLWWINESWSINVRIQCKISENICRQIGQNLFFMFYLPYAPMTWKIMHYGYKEEKIIA